jgi:hypothetical protein
LRLQVDHRGILDDEVGNAIGRSFDNLRRKCTKSERKAGEQKHIDGK